MPTTCFSSKFSSFVPCKDGTFIRFDILCKNVNSCAFPDRLDTRPRQQEIRRNRFDAIRWGDAPKVFANRFNATPYLTTMLYNRWNVLNRILNTVAFSDKFNTVTLRNAFCFNHWDALNDFPNHSFRLVWRFDSRWGYSSKTNNRFQIISDSIAKISYGRYPSRFNIGKSGNNFFRNRFDIIPQDFFTLFRNRFDCTGSYLAGTPLHFQTFVKPGWRIIAKNIETSEIVDLGFIDAESKTHELENIFLPDGDYEISVLTSSLFWKDTLDSNTRQLAIRPDAEITPLPTIFNLRSSISQGETTIYWSASRSEVSDCVFGVWYSSETPVDTDRPPDSTIWYLPEMTEYQTSFKQTAPCYAAVGAIRTGDEPETGKVHELYLNWSDTKPRSPDDVMVLDKMLPVVDPRPIENEDGFTRWE